MTDQPSSPLRRQRHVITIDGPAGAGKSTIAKLLAERLGWFHLDSGATYRTVAAAAVLRGIASDDAASLGALVERLHIEVRQQDGSQRFLADGEDVTELIRSPEVTRASSPVSAVPVVRHRLFAIQREIAEGRDTVAEGRDMGTVVFPRAIVKVFLTASARVRAARRLNDFRKGSADMTFEQVLRDIEERDMRDSTRAVSPLRPADDARTIVTDDLSPEQIVEQIVSAYNNAAL